MIRTVLVTPTRVLVSPPQQEPSNSVTRRYHDKLDGIIRVQFADEEDKLFVSAVSSSVMLTSTGCGVYQTSGSDTEGCRSHGAC